LQIRFLGSNLGAQAPSVTSEGYRHFFVGADPARWVHNVPCYRRATYTNLYPGVDLVVFRGWERTACAFCLQPGADPAAIRFAVDGGGAPAVQSDGTLGVSIGRTQVAQFAPVAFRSAPTQYEPVACRYVVAHDEVGLELPRPGRDDASARQAVLNLLTFLGGSGTEEGTALAIGDDGCAYVAGTTTAPGFPSRAPGDTSARDDVTAFVIKLRLADLSHVYTVFLGGRSQDRALGVAADGAGCAYVCGETLSDDFPAAPLPPTKTASSWDAFVVKLSPDGTQLATAVRLGGGADDRAFGVALDAATNIYVAGETASGDFPRAGPEENVGGRGWDAFVAKLDPTGHLLFSTWLGGNGDDSAHGLAVDPDGGAWVAGETSSRDFTVRRAQQAEHGGGEWDAFVARLTATGSLAYATYLGGANDDRGHGVALDGMGQVYVVGETASSNFPAVAGVQAGHAGGDWDMFVAALSADGARLVRATCLGGDDDDRAFAVQVSADGEVHVVGTTTSTNFPAPNGWQRQPGGNWDGVACALDPWSQRLVYSTYVGGAGDDALTGVALDRRGNPLWSGRTASSELTTVNALQARAGGDGDALVVAAVLHSTAPPELCRVGGGGQTNGPDYDFYMATYEITNEQYLRFLNDAEAHPKAAQGANVHVDEGGNVWMDPAQHRPERRLFDLKESRLVYRRDLPPGRRYELTRAVPETGGSYARHPVTGVSWYGAVKYCNWLTLETGGSPDDCCYREGPHELDWAPATAPADAWRAGHFAAAARQAWLARGGYRLPMDDGSGTTNGPAPYNEFYKAAAWNGSTNMPFGFGRARAQAGDANFLDHGLLARHDTTPVGYFGGGRTPEEMPTRTNANAYGICDLSGNVAEWINDFGIEGSTQDRACGGGSWRAPLPRLDERLYVHPFFADRFCGFRVMTTRLPQEVLTVRCGDWHETAP